MRLRAVAVMVEQPAVRRGVSPGVVGRACRGPSPGERSRSELLDMHITRLFRDCRYGNDQRTAPRRSPQKTIASRFRGDSWLKDG
jgi:hypothetical protein